MSHKWLIPMHEEEIDLLSYVPTTKRKDKLDKYSLSFIQDICKKHGVSLTHVQHQDIRDEKHECVQLLVRNYNQKHPYTSYRASELKDFIKRRGIGGFSGTRKVELINLLETMDLRRRIPLMKLPPEIRALVYHYAFLQTRDSRAHVVQKSGEAQLQNRSRFYGDGSDADFEHAVTRTSRQIRNESLPVFYATHRFHLGAASFERLRWMDYISADKLRDIRKLKVCFHNIAILVDLRMHANVVHSMTMQRETPTTMVHTPIDKATFRISDPVPTLMPKDMDKLLDKLKKGLEIVVGDPGMEKFGRKEFRLLHQLVSSV